MLKIGQRWRHIYDGANNGHHDYHNFVVEVIAIEDERVKCRIVQIVVNNNQTWHSNSKLGDDYFVKTIPRTSDYVEGANGANTWALLHGQDKIKEPAHEYTYGGIDMGLPGKSI